MESQQLYIYILTASNSLGYSFSKFLRYTQHISSNTEKTPGFESHFPMYQDIHHSSNWNDSDPEFRTNGLYLG
jgi:hypothetical protein